MINAKEVLSKMQKEFPESLSWDMGSDLDIKRDIYDDIKNFIINKLNFRVAWEDDKNTFVNEYENILLIVDTSNQKVIGCDEDKDE